MPGKARSNVSFIGVHKYGHSLQSYGRHLPYTVSHSICPVTPRSTLCTLVLYLLAGMERNNLSMVIATIRISNCFHSSCLELGSLIWKLPQEMNSKALLSWTEFANSTL